MDIFSQSDLDNSESLITSNAERSDAYYYLIFLYIGIGVITCCCVSFCSCVMLKYYYDKKTSEEDTNMTATTIGSISVSPSIVPSASSFEGAHMSTNPIQSYHTSGNSLALEEISTPKSNMHVHTHTTLGCNFDEDEDEDDSDSDDENVATTQRPKITIGAEQNNLNIEDDEFVIEYEDQTNDHEFTAGKDVDGEMDTDVNASSLVAAKPHHFVQMTNLASEGGFDDAFRM